MSEIDRIRDELWHTYDRLSEQEIDLDEAEQLVNALDSLTQLLRIDLYGGVPRDGAVSPPGPLRQARGGANE